MYHSHRKGPPRARRCAIPRAGPAVPEGACASGLTDSKLSLRRPDPGAPATPRRALSPAVGAARRPRRIDRYLTNGRALQVSGADVNVPAVRRLVRQMAWPGAPGSAAIPLATGRLTVRKEDPAFASRQRVLEAEAGRLGTTIDALALAAALAQPWADVVLS